MARNNVNSDMVPVNRPKFNEGIEIALAELLKEKRVLRETVDDIKDECLEGPEDIIENIKKCLRQNSQIELILRGLRDILFE